MKRLLFLFLLLVANKGFAQNAYVQVTPSMLYYNFGTHQWYINAVPSATATGSATPTMTNTPTGSATPTPTNTLSFTMTPTGTVTKTPTITVTPTRTGSATFTPTPTIPLFVRKNPVVMDDFITNTAYMTSPFMPFYSGSITQITNVEPTAGNQIGVVQLATSTSSYGYSYIMTNPNIYVMGSGGIHFESLLRTPTFSTGSEEFEIRTGLSDSYLGQGNGVYFYSSSAVQGGNWLACSYAGGVGTCLDTKQSNNQTVYHRYSFFIDGGGECWFYYDDVLVAFKSDNVPSGDTQPVGVLGASIVKTNGYSDRSVQVDYVYASPIFGSAR